MPRKPKSAKKIGPPAKPRAVVKLDSGKKMQVRSVIGQRAVLGALKEFRGNISKACEAADVSRQAYYDFLKDPDFAHAVEAIKEGIVDEYVDALNDIALNQKFFPAVKYFLDNHAQDRGFGREVKAAEDAAKTSKAPVNNTQINLTTLPPEVLQQLRQALAISAGEAEKV